MVGKKRGLGKGLAALIPNEPIDSLLDEGMESESISNIEISLVEPNEGQPRKEFEEESLRELKNSIEQYGLIQPIVVRKQGNKYEIIAGERRWRAAKLANLKEIPCIIKEVDDKESMKLALIENLQRENLNPIEEAYAYDRLMKEYNLTQEEVALSMGKSRSYIANTVRLLNLDEEIKNHIANGKITSGHGRAILGIASRTKRLEMAESVINNRKNVRETEDMVKKIKKSKSKSRFLKEDPFVREMEEELMRTLGTKVKLTSKKDGGTIEIQYYGEEDLERIIELLTK